MKLGFNPKHSSAAAAFFQTICAHLSHQDIVYQSLGVTQLGQLVDAPFPLQHDLPFDDLLKVDKRLSSMCPNTFWNTIKSTTNVLEDGSTFIFTGDIDDLWIRDSCAQVRSCFRSSDETGSPLYSSGKDGSCLETSYQWPHPTPCLLHRLWPLR